METITFENLPAAVTQLYEKLISIERILNTLSPQADEDLLLTIQEASTVIHLSVPTLYGLVHNKQIPFCKKSKRLYFSKKELILWVREGRKKTISEITEDAEIHLALAKRQKS